MKRPKPFLFLLILPAFFSAASAQAAFFSIFNVTSSLDPGNTYTANTLRWAVAKVNGTTGGCTINIQATSPSSTIAVDGNFGPLYLYQQCYIQADPANHNVIAGTNNANFGLVLSSGSDGTVIDDICMTNFKITSGAATGQGAGLVIQGSNNSQVRGGRYGTNWSNQSGIGNDNGIFFSAGCTGNIICSSVNYPGNPIVISGNLHNGVWANHTSYLTVKGAYVGTASDGATALPNAGNGILLEDQIFTSPIGGATYCTIGGAYSTDRNVISGNGGSGIEIRNANAYSPALTGHNVVTGNIIGLNLNANAAVPNSVDGVSVSKTNFNTIGDGSNPDFKNIIAGNGYSGVDLEFDYGDVVQNNVIGATLPAIPNTDGIYMAASQSCLIGGVQNNSSRWDSNVIGGNGVNTLKTGIELAADANGNTISGNFFDLQSTNAYYQHQNRNIYITQGSHNLIGGQNTGGVFRGNVVCGNAAGSTAGAIHVAQGDGNSICGNYVGLTTNGLAPLPNVSPSGIFINSLATHTLVGGPDATWGNVVAGMGNGSATSSYGIYINGATDCVVAGNRVGVSADGMTVIPNNASGILLLQSAGRVGGLTAGERNQICGYTGNTGIEVSDVAANGRGNTVVGNWINVLANGAPDPANLLDAGILFSQYVNGAQGNLIGYKNNPASGNLIAGVQVAGILVNTKCVNNGFFSNTICAIANVRQGIYLDAPGSPSGNYEKSAPLITSSVSTVSGLSGHNDYIEVFLSDPNPAFCPGSLRLVGSGTADGTGHWTISVSGVSAGQFITALATDTSNNTSPFSTAHLYGPPYTTTVTVSPTITPTATISATSTISATCTVSPTVTPTPTVTVTPNSGSLLAALGGHDVLAYPNPGHGSIHFILKLDQTADVKIIVYNMAGEKVAALAGTLNGPVGSLAWDCSQAGKGIYLARVFAKNHEIATLKVAVIK